MGHQSNLEDRQQRILIGAVGLAANTLVELGDAQAVLVAMALSALVRDIAAELGYDAVSLSFMQAVQNEAFEFAKESLVK